MLDSAANLLIRWILRDGGMIETAKTQDDLLPNNSILIKKKRKKFRC